MKRIGMRSLYDELEFYELDAEGEDQTFDDMINE
jgi:hypothetical protein